MLGDPLYPQENYFVALLGLLLARKDSAVIPFAIVKFNGSVYIKWLFA